MHGALSVLLQLPLTELTAGRINIRTQLAPHGRGNAALLERLLEPADGFRLWTASADFPPPHSAE